MELGIGYFVGWLKAAVERRELLHCVVSQVDFPFKVEDVELVGGSPDVTLLVPVCLEDSIELADHHIMANVKLPLLVEKRTVDVELNYKGFLRSVLVLALTLHDGVKFIWLVDDSDSVASICEFSWLHNPYIPHWSSHRHPIFPFLFLLADDGLAFLVIANEAFILRISSALFDVEGQGNDLEEISSYQLVVFF